MILLETMSKEVEKYLLQEGFSKDEIDELVPFLVPLKLKKNEHFIEQGEICYKSGFIISGILRNYYLSAKGEEITYCLTFPGNFVNAFSSFITGNPTKENIHAITDVEMLVVPKQVTDRLKETNDKWKEFFNVLTQKAYIKLEDYIFMLQMESAEDRYKTLIKNYPEYIQFIPLKYLSSYLGITQRHLSRIRKLPNL